MNEFKDKVVIITGGASGIGLALVERFKSLGAKVAIIDIKENEYFVGNLSKQAVLESFVKKVLTDFKQVDILINNAIPPTKGINDCSYEEFEEALKIGVTAPFYLVKLLKDHFNSEGSVINISSTRAHMSQPQNEAYVATKGAISALTHALSNSLAGKVRVNAISPGWIDTKNYQASLADKQQHSVKRLGKTDDIVELVLYLTSSKASFINGQDIIIDGGMTKQMIYHNDHGWQLGEKE